jgi:hypothetical protein
MLDVVAAHDDELSIAPEFESIDDVHSLLAAVPVQHP